MKLTTQIRHDPEGSKSFNLLQLFAYGDLRSIPGKLYPPIRPLR